MTSTRIWCNSDSERENVEANSWCLAATRHIRVCCTKTLFLWQTCKAVLLLCQANHHLHICTHVTKRIERSMQQQRGEPRFLAARPCSARCDIKMQLSLPKSGRKKKAPRFHSFSLFYYILLLLLVHSLHFATCRHSRLDQHRTWSRHRSFCWSRNGPNIKLSQRHRRHGPWHVHRVHLKLAKSHENALWYVPNWMHTVMYDI